MNKKESPLIPYAFTFQQNEAEMSLSEHLEEVRQRAFWSLASLVVDNYCMFSKCKKYCKTITRTSIRN